MQHALEPPATPRIDLALDAGKPERDLAPRRIRRIGSVHQIELRFQPEIAPDGAGRGLLHRVSAPGELANRRRTSAASSLIRHADVCAAPNSTITSRTRAPARKRATTAAGSGGDNNRYRPRPPRCFAIQPPITQHETDRVADESTPVICSRLEGPPRPPPRARAVGFTRGSTGCDDPPQMLDRIRAAFDAYPR